MFGNWIILAAAIECVVFGALNIAYGHVWLGGLLMVFAVFYSIGWQRRR